MQKKVLKDTNGYYRCESCQENFETCEFKYILSMKLQDFSDCLWITAFDDVANQILGITATGLHNSFIENIELFEETINKSHMKRIEGVVKVKINETQQGKKSKYILHSVKAPDISKSLAKNLLLIKQALINSN